MNPPLLKKFLAQPSFEIITEPDERLHRVSTDYLENDSLDLIKLKEIMYNLMTSAQGIGLAAPQVALNLNIILVMIFSGDKNEERTPTLMVNPKITEISGIQSIKEGCLSLPGMQVEVPRCQEIKVEFLDEFLNPQTLFLNGINSICVQHERDHLLGILMSQYETGPVA